MPTANDLLAYTLAATQQMLTNFCQDLTPQEYLHRPCTGGNAASFGCDSTAGFIAASGGPFETPFKNTSSTIWSK